MTTTLQTLGWTAVMLCELMPHLRLLLQQRYPGASVLPDMDSEPWLEWAGAGLTALLIVAGISCQPFSPAGRMLGSLDPRSMDAFKVLKAATHLDTRYILLENVLEYVTNDNAHGVFSLVTAEYRKANFRLHSVTERLHTSCGGHTSRKRVFILFLHSSVQAQAQVPAPITVLRFPSLQGHHRCNWTTRGSLEPYRHGVASSGLHPACYLQLGGSSVSEGSIVTLPDDPSVLWKVQGSLGASLLLKSHDSNRPSRSLRIHHTLIGEHLICPESKYTVYMPTGTLPMLRSFGDPPGMGGPLVMVAPDDVRALSTSDRCSLQEIALDDADFLTALGCAEESIWQALGNTIPASMVLGNLLHITTSALALQGAPQQHKEHSHDQPPLQRRTAPELDLAEQQASAGKRRRTKRQPSRRDDNMFLKRIASEALGASTETLAQVLPPVPPRAHAPEVTALVDPGYHRILLIPVHVPTATAWLAKNSGSAALSVDAPTSACGRGNLTRHVAHLMGPWAEPTSLALAGHCQVGGTYMSVVTVAVVDAALLSCILSPYTQTQLDHLATEIPASLAVATSRSHGPGDLMLADIAPIALGQNAWGGATAPKRLRKTRISSDTAPAPQDILINMRHIEACLSHDLADAEAEARLAGDYGLATYCAEWQMQVTASDLKGIPAGMLQALPLFSDPRLASIPFARCSDLPATVELPPVPDQPSDPSFTPQCEADILTAEAIRALDAADAKSLAYIRLQSTPGITEEQLKLARPASVFLGQDAFLPVARGKVYDMRGARPKLHDMNADIQTHLNRDYFSRMANSIPWVARDKQLLQQIHSGIRSQTTLPLQFRNMPPLISLAAGVPNIGGELLRLRGLEYIEQHRSRPFLPMFLNPQGARAKKGTSKLRRISEMGAPRKPAVDTEGVDVEPFNLNAKFFPDGSLKLPKQVMPRPEDVMTDASVLRHIGDLMGQPLVAWTDDLKDFFNQLKLHPSELHKMCFNWQDLDDPDGTLKTIVESVLGFGHVFASNIAQRFSNAVVQFFLAEFDKVDAPFLEEDCKRYPVLRAWIQHRAQLSSHSDEYNQARLMAANMYCDDLLAQVIGTQRAVRAKVCWYRVTRTLNLLTAEPRKRLTGLRIPWTGLEYLPMLGIVLIPESKTTAALAVLALAERGRCEVGTAYRPLMGLIQFLRHVLRLPRTTVAWMLEPLRGGHEIDSGPSTWVRATRERKLQWGDWRKRLISTHCASFASVLPETPDPPLTTRAAAWHGDAALAGTIAPGMCGHCHGLYWIFSLRARHLRLTIAALEFLTVLGNFLMFGPMYTSTKPSKKDDLVILLQCDSLVSTHVLSNDAAKDRVLLFIHMQLLQLPEFCSLQDSIIVGHEWGERNVLTDHGSRGREDNLIACCAAFGTKAQRVPIHPGFTAIVERTVAFMSDSPCNEQQTGSARKP